jgi:cytochrome c oxidase cbb3-type subunit 3
LIIWYATIAIAVVMWVLYPAWPGVSSYTRGILNQSDRTQVVRDLNALKATRKGLGDDLVAAPLDSVLSNSTLKNYALAAGEAAFGDNCATCHGQGGRGATGYPSLADDVWLWGGTLADIERTIKVGVRTDDPDTRYSLMPAYGQGMLKPAQIDDLTDYVLRLSGQGGSEQAAARAAPLFQTNCAVCHGADGNGLRTMGAPSLRDKVWLYGGARNEIRDQIALGRNGVMPTWAARLPPDTVRALTIYVHELGGGEASPAAAPVTPPDSEPASTAPPR